MILFLKEITSYFHEEHVTLVIVKKKETDFLLSKNEITFYFRNIFGEEKSFNLRLRWSKISIGKIFIDVLFNSRCYKPND